MDDFTVDDAVMKCLIVKKVKHVLDSVRQYVASARDPEQSLKKVVDVHLQGALKTTHCER